MATTTIITGSSDDLLEFEGHLYEEFSVDGNNGLLEFSDGTTLRVNYGKGGIWRFAAEVEGPAFQSIARCTGDDEDEYTDTVKMGQVDWAKYSEAGQVQRVFAKGIKNPLEPIIAILRRYDDEEAAERIQQHIDANYLPR